jgi:signal peptidase I
VCLALLGVFVRRWLLYVTVHGNSMAPEFRHGDGVLAVRVPPAKVRRGRVVVGLTPDSHLDPEAVAAGIPPHFVKRVVGVGGDQVPRPDGVVTVPDGSYYVQGEADFSVDSNEWGPVDGSRLIGVVLQRLSWARD